MAKSKRPIQYLKINQCRNCKGRLQLVEEETYVAALDSRGLPIGGQSFVDMRLRCTKCGEEYDCVKEGMHYAIAPKTQPIPVIVKDYNPFYA